MTPRSIVKANARHRWLMLTTMLLLIFLGSLLAVGFRPYSEKRLKAFEQKIRQKPYPELVSELKLVSAVVSLVATAPLLAMGAALLHQSRRIRAAQQYPYPGMLLLRDTKLQTGSAALERGRITSFVGTALLVLGVVIAPLMYVMFVSLIPHK